MVLIVFIVAFTVGWLSNQFLAQNSIETLISRGSYASESSYTVFVDGDVIKARNEVSGNIEFSDSDFSTVMQQLIDSLVNGGTILITRGLYTVTKTINIVNEAVYIKGEGRGYDIYGTVLKLAAELTNTTVFRYNPSDRHKYFGGISDLTIDGNDNVGSVGIHVKKYFSDLKFENLWLKNCAGAGIKIEGAGDPTGASHVWNIWIVDCLVESCGYGIYLTNADNYMHKISRVTIRGGHFYDNINSIRIDAEYSFNILIEGITAERDRQHCIYMTAGRRVQIVNNRIYDIGTDALNTYDGIHITSTYNNPPIDILIQGNNIGNHWIENQMRYCIVVNGSVHHVKITDNILDTWKSVVPLQPIYYGLNVKDLEIHFNQNYPTESYGIVNITGTGSQTEFEVIAQHGLVNDKVIVSASIIKAAAPRPSYIYAYLNDTDVDGFKETIIIIVKFDVAPASGELIYICWKAEAIIP